LTTYTHDSLSTSNYSATAISIIHKLPQHPLSLFPACCAFTNRSLATASNSGDSSASRAQVLSSQPPIQNSPDSACPLLKTSRHGPHSFGAHAAYAMSTGVSFPGVQRPGREADHSPPTSAEVKKTWVYTSTPHTSSWRSA
jgi:hypothetical protein